MSLNTFKKNIYFRVGAIIFIGILIPALLMGFFEYHSLEKRLLEKTHDHVKDATKLMSLSLSRPLWDYSEQTTGSIVRATFTDEEILEVRVLDNNNKLFYKVDYSQQKKVDTSKGIFYVENPINHEGKLIGKVSVSYTVSNVYTTLSELLFKFLITRFVQLAITLVTVLIFLNLSLLKRITLLSRQARKLDKQILDEPFHWDHGDPIDELGRDLDSARHSLNALFHEVKVKNEELFKLNLELENKVKEKTQQVVHAARMVALGEMAAGVAHEINNPLTVIMATSKSIDSGLKTNRFTQEEISQRLQKITLMSERINKIVKGLRSFSGHSEKDQMKKVPLDKIINETLVLCQEKLKNDNITFYLVAMPELEIECRSIEISQVLLNLINNASDAIKNLERKWIALEIGVLPEKMLQIKVIDSGKGIEPKIANKIMQPFFTTKDVDRGTGLGLSISSGIIEDHNGRLWLDQEAENTTFIVHVPMEHQNQVQI